jgi:hypothetical protein
MHLRSIAVATMALVRCSAEDRLVRRSLTRLAQVGIPIAVADAGTSAAFTDFVDRLPGVVLTAPARGGLVGQVQAAVDAAAAFDRPFILYTEPDKEAFFAGHLREFVDRAPEGDDVGIVVASRSSSSFDTFPTTQRHVESIVNHLCSARIGVSADYSYGPFVMHRALVRHVRNADTQLGWGWRPFIFMTAHREGLRVTYVTGDYECPSDQRDDDDNERAHRLRQLRENLSGLVT